MKAIDLSEGDIIRTHFGKAQVVEVVKNLSADKYTQGIEVTLDYLKHKVKGKPIRRTVIRGANTPVEIERF